MEMETSSPWKIQQTFSNEPTKKKMTMKTKNMLWAALSMTAALVMTACSSDDIEMTEKPLAPSATKTIPYTVTVSDGAETRATVDSDNKTLKFADGDKLYVTGTNIKGVLNIQTGATTASATFSGDLTYTGGGSPADDLALTATLVSAQQTVGTQVSVDDNGAVTVNYPTTAYCTSVNDAVQKYSNLTGSSTYAAKSFSLTQQTAFLNFEITSSGSTGNYTAPAKFINNGSDFATANVTTVNDGGSIKAKFVLPVASGTALSNATVKFAGKQITGSISDATLTAKVYNVKKTVDMSAVTLAETKTTAGMTVKVKYNYNGENYCLFSSNGDDTYTFQSGSGYVGGDGNCAKALVVEGGKLVFKQNFRNTIDYQWSLYGFSATFDTSNNSYIQFVGPFAQDQFNPSYISVEVNGKAIALTKIITVSDLVKVDGQRWSEIIDNNSDKIKADDDYGDYVVRISDGAKLQRNMYGDVWQDVAIYDDYQSMDTYKFEGD